MISTKNRMTVIRSIVVVLSGLALTSSSAHAASNNAATTIEWSSQTVLKCQVTIPAGQTVTVTPKAKIIVNDGTKIIIDGRLIAPSGLSLTIHHGDISGVLGASDVEGKFVADSLRYDKGAGGGINSNNGTGSITIDNSLSQDCRI
jgi:ABC-type Fe3+-hydroxamate transport system substrate-binding protein